jgi:hypothetical protein
MAWKADRLRAAKVLQALCQHCWIRHEGVIVQLYAVPRHARNIDIAKQWSDITRERNLGYTFSFLPAEWEPRIRNV